MIQTAEQLFESVKTLPSAERERIFQMVESERRNGYSADQDQELQNGKFRQALKWVDEHRKEYDGQFVLLDGDVLLDHGTDPKKLYANARKRGIQIPFVKRVKAEILPFGGW